MHTLILETKPVFFNLCPNKEIINQSDSRDEACLLQPVSMPIAAVAPHEFLRVRVRIRVRVRVRVRVQDVRMLGTLTLTFASISTSVP